jgi:hypothetical protein
VVDEREAGRENRSCEYIEQANPSAANGH